MTIDQTPEDTAVGPAREVARKSGLARVPLWAKITVPAVVIVVIAAIAIPVALQPGSITVHGTLSVANTDGASDPCAIAGYEDIREGASVTVTDATHKTIALGALQAGHADSLGLSCVYNFTVKDVPAGSGFYGIEVSHRGSVQFTSGQIRKGVGLSLG